MQEEIEESELDSPTLIPYFRENPIFKYFEGDVNIAFEPIQTILENVVWSLILKCGSKVPTDENALSFCREQLVLNVEKFVSYLDYLYSISGKDIRRASSFGTHVQNVKGTYRSMLMSWIKLASLSKSPQTHKVAKDKEDIKNDLTVLGLLAKLGVDIPLEADIELVNFEKSLSKLATHRRSSKTFQVIGNGPERGRVDVVYSYVLDSFYKFSSIVAKAVYQYKKEILVLPPGHMVNHMIHLKPLPAFYESNNNNNNNNNNTNKPPGTTPAAIPRPMNAGPRKPETLPPGSVIRPMTSPGSSRVNNFPSAGEMGSLQRPYTLLDIAQAKRLIASKQVIKLDHDKNGNTYFIFSSGRFVYITKESELVWLEANKPKENPPFPIMPEIPVETQEALNYSTLGSSKNPVLFPREKLQEFLDENKVRGVYRASDGYVLHMSGNIRYYVTNESALYVFFRLREKNMRKDTQPPQNQNPTPEKPTEEYGTPARPKTLSDSDIKSMKENNQLRFLKHETFTGLYKVELWDGTVIYITEETAKRMIEQHLIFPDIEIRKRGQESNEEQEKRRRIQGGILSELIGNNEFEDEIIIDYVNDTARQHTDMFFDVLFTEAVTLALNIKFGRIHKNDAMVTTGKRQLKQNKIAFASYTEVLKEERAIGESEKTNVQNLAYSYNEFVDSIYVETKKSSKKIFIVNMSKVFEETGFVTLDEHKKEARKLWKDFKSNLAKCFSTNDFEKYSMVVRLSATVFATFIAERIRDRTVYDLGYEPKKAVVSNTLTTEKLVSEVESIRTNVDFVSEQYIFVSWGIDANYSTPTQNVTINWQQVGNMLSRVLGLILSYNPDDRKRAVVKSFLNWYDIMKGSNASIFSQYMKDWIVIGRVHVRNVVNILMRMPYETGSKVALSDFLGCRKALGTWYLGIIEALLMREGNPQTRAYLESFFKDMERVCKQL